MSSDGMAMPTGNAGAASARTRVSAGARARARVADGHLDVKAVARRVTAVVWGDFTRSWITSGSTPTVTAYLAAERAAPAPYGKQWLRLARLGWVFTVGMVGMVAGHVLAHLLQSPVRTAVTTVVVGAIFLIRVLG